MKKKKYFYALCCCYYYFICAVVISLGVFLLYVQKSIDTNSQKTMTNNVAKQVIMRYPFSIFITDF